MKKLVTNLNCQSFWNSRFIKRLMLVGITIVLFANTILAQENTTSTHFALGFQLSEYQNDFGVGLSATSPYFANNRLAIRLRGNLMWNEYLKDEEACCSPYGNLTLGAVVVAGQFAGFVKVYAEGGFVGLIPNAEYSNESFVPGGYGLLGFEFYPGKRTCYFIEAGGVCTGAKADNLPVTPFYSNGFLISTGIRFHIK